ncbi:MAG: hypothetical protein GWM98_00130 [Nitrospinaceae bacterium]|nr:hypothetical protein [Nitrospinaceae bacterium]NIR53218.1 hypothetical protein [Nitrospinaceae bacterium]NIS83613.1 hypothetical protein [Nitrospinaceae bacterium]NIT80403.1 hypothetical protein [Nitrospinaceae bacterium]NIU42746.1 hypothetical protein [Nitrospinaceae bacterium]
MKPSKRLTGRDFLWHCGWMMALGACAACASGGPAPRTQPTPTTPEPRVERPEPVREPPQRVLKEDAATARLPGKTAPSPEKPSAAPPPARPEPEKSKEGGPDFLDLLGGKQPEMSVAESGSGSSIRGLSPLSQEYAERQDLSRQSVEAVQTMESFQLPENLLNRFLKEGRLGKYQSNPPAAR